MWPWALITTCHWRMTCSTARLSLLPLGMFSHCFHLHQEPSHVPVLTDWCDTVLAKIGARGWWGRGIWHGKIHQNFSSNNTIMDQWQKNTIPQINFCIRAGQEQISMPSQAFSYRPPVTLTKWIDVLHTLFVGGAAGQVEFILCAFLPSLTLKWGLWFLPAPFDLPIT